jgi:hypothetical protein
MLNILKNIREKFDNIKSEKNSSSDSKDSNDNKDERRRNDNGDNSDLNKIKDSLKSIKDDVADDISSKISSKVKNPNNIVFYGMVGAGLIVIIIIAVVIYNYFFSSSTSLNTDQNSSNSTSSFFASSPGKATTPVAQEAPVAQSVAPVAQAVAPAAVAIPLAANEVYQQYKAETIKPEINNNPYYQSPVKELLPEIQNPPSLKQDYSDNTYLQPQPSSLSTIRSKSKSLFDNFYTSPPTIIPQSQTVKSEKSLESSIDIPTIPSKTTDELNQKTMPSSLASFFSFSNVKKEDEEEKPKITGGKKPRRKPIRKYIPRKK